MLSIDSDSALALETQMSGARRCVLTHSSVCPGPRLGGWADWTCALSELWERALAGT